MAACVPPVTLWCISGAPLLAGTVLVHATNETLAILANPEVTAIDQDLGKNGAIQVCLKILDNLSADVDRALQSMNVWQCVIYRRAL